MMPHPRIRLLVTVAASAFAAGPVAGQMPVYDPQNFAQNVLQAARALQQINNQIQQINNQTQSLINQAKNLVSLPYSLVSTITSQIQRTEQLITQAQRIAYSVATIDQAFTTNYNAINLNLSQQQMIGQAQQRWQNSMAGLQDAMRMQATVVGNISTSRSTVTSLGSSSQSASGALQASQVSNQLLVQISQELADLVALQSAHSRAQSLIAAGQLTDKGQAQAQLAPYYARTTYQPQSVTP
jgi:P-type conjugative transfer protein TrbJ